MNYCNYSLFNWTLRNFMPMQ